jgi:hypothetical protein
MHLDAYFEHTPPTLVLLIVSLGTLAHLLFATIILGYFTMLSVSGLHRIALYFDYEQ